MSLLSHFFRQSKTKIQREAKKALSLDELLNRRVELAMFNFKDKSKVSEDWIVGSDADIGGKSEANLTVNQGVGVFSGNISPYLPDRMEVKVNGYAAMRNVAIDYGMFGSELFDTLPYRYLALRVKLKSLKGDKGQLRRFTVNLQTDSLIPNDLYQHRIFIRKPDAWETVLIPFNQFILTNDGNVEAQQLAMFRERVKTVGIALLDCQPGPFHLEIDWIKAINTDYTDGDIDTVPSEY